MTARATFVMGAGVAARRAPRRRRQLRARSARPDLSGFWINQYTPDLSTALGKQPPFTDYGAERWRTVDTAKDPTGICLPPGPSRGFTAPFPFLLVQHADMIAVLFDTKRSGA